MEDDELSCTLTQMNVAKLTEAAKDLNVATHKARAPAPDIGILLHVNNVKFSSGVTVGC